MSFVVFHWSFPNTGVSRWASGITLTLFLQLSIWNRNTSCLHTWEYNKFTPTRGSICNSNHLHNTESSAKDLNLCKRWIQAGGRWLEAYPVGGTSSSVALDTLNEQLDIPSYVMATSALSSSALCLRDWDIVFTFTSHYITTVLPWQPNLNLEIILLKSWVFLSLYYILCVLQNENKKTQEKWLWSEMVSSQLICQNLLFSNHSG